MTTKYLTLLFLALSCFAFGQEVNVTGTITDQTYGQPLPGVNVIIENTTRGTSSDFDGNFILNNVSLNSIIVISYLGYISQEITIINNQPLQIILQEDAESLDEVVVVGYGTQTKKEITGAVTVLDSKDIEKFNPVRVEQAIQGQVAGVNITSTSGSPGNGLNIRIRGITTNGDNRPLILVDGNRIEDLSVINPNDIKTINILKDATAGIYGVQAANGVILITTKTGRKGSELKFQLDSYSGFQTTSKKIDLLDPTDFAIYVNDASNQTEFFVYPQDGTDWQDEVLQTAAISSTNFSASGGTEKLAYSGGISYLNQDGIVGLSKSNYERLTSRINLQYDILENLKLTTTGLHTISEKNNLPEGGIGSVLYNTVNINPTLAVRDENGQFSLANDISQIEIINPLAQIANTYNTTRVSKVSGTLGLDYTFWKNFTASSKFQINHANVRDDIFRPEQYYGNGKGANIGDPDDDNITNEVVDFGADFNDFTWDNYLTYNKTFNEKHDLTVLLGTSFYRTKGTFYGYVGRTNLGTNSQNQTVFDTGMVPVNRFNENAIDDGLDRFDTRLYSIFSRVQYNFKGKYLLSAVLRRDVSSQFSPKDDNNVGYFPSGSIGWNVSDEEFLQNSSWLNTLKLRASYGIIGNDRIPSFAFVTLLDGEATTDPGNANVFEDLIFGAAAGTQGNENLKWEEQETINFGFDARLFDNKINISVDAFRKQTKDLLLQPQASAVTGVGAPNPNPDVSLFAFVNAGTVENKGLEFLIGYNDDFSDDFNFNMSFNLTTLENEVTSVNGRTPPVSGEFGVGISQTGISRMIPGLPLGHYYGYETNGVYQSQTEIDVLNASAPNDAPNEVYHEGAAPGDLRFVDTNGNGYIDAEDRTNIGDPIPEITMGFNIGFNYKNIDFSASAFASIGNDMIRDYERKDLYANRGTYILDRWQGSGTSNFVPRAVSGGSINTDVFSDYYVEDASYVRLQNVQIGYSLSDRVISSLGLYKFRIYVSGNNLFTISDYFGYDPSASSGAPLGGGIDKGFYPVASTYLIGINLNF